MNPSRGFLRSLFHGELLQEMVLPYPEMPPEEKETLNLLLASLDEFLEAHVDARKIDEEGVIPEEVRDGLFELGVMGMTIPEEYGGYGLSPSAYLRVNEKVASICASTTTFLGGHQSIGLKGILLFGTEEQKQRLLPRLASGELVAAFALTEPQAGSDVKSIRSTAELNSDGTRFMLNGRKIWITNGGLANLFTVFAKTVQDGEEGITAFIVTRDLGGVSSGSEEEKMGIRGSSTTELLLENVPVPAENVIGRVNGGFRVAMEVLNTGRMSLAAGCVGGAKRMIKEATRYANERKQFGRCIGEYEMIREKITQMAMQTYVLESMVYLTSAWMDRDVEDFSLEAALCKIYGSEISWEVANHALQIAGGYGFSKEYPFERFVRDARINLIFEGTNEILRMYVALSGMKGVGEELSAVRRSPMKMTAWILRDIFHNMTSISHPVLGLQPSLGPQAKMIGSAVAIFSKTVQRVLRKYGRGVLERQYMQRRLSDMALFLFGMIAACSRASTALQKNGASAKEELAVSQHYCQEAIGLIRKLALDAKENSDATRNEIAEEALREERWIGQ